MTVFDEKYWTNRYHNGQTQWDAGGITIPLQVFFNQLLNKDLKILIPGGGNGYEAAYLHELGFKNVYLLDFSSPPLESFSRRNPSFPKAHLLHQDFFSVSGEYDLVVEQTFFCALHPGRRQDYARKVAEILKPGGRLVGLLFEDIPQSNQPPFGGSREEYRKYFNPYFEIHRMEDCYNSIKPRKGKELWIELIKRS